VFDLRIHGCCWSILLILSAALLICRGVVAFAFSFAAFIDRAHCRLSENRPTAARWAGFVGRLAPPAASHLVFSRRFMEAVGLFSVGPEVSSFST
jgi:hypothetical protein